MMSLPAAMRPYLKGQLDWDNNEDRDLCEIAYHMLDWELWVPIHMNLTEVDIRDIKETNKEPELQR